MEFNNKKLERTSKMINTIIAVVLCSFLISLSSKIFDDVDDWKKRPKLESFENRSFLSDQESEIAKIDLKIKGFSEKKSTIKNTLDAIDTQYKSAKESFDTWIKTRKALGSSNEDKEVRKKANELDVLYRSREKWEAELLSINKTIRELRNESSNYQKKINTEIARARKEHQKEIRKYDTKVFLLRLLFILPILLLGIYLAIKFRKHKYWPIFLGFILFALYAFFFGLVPYLPSYGGYVRSIVGILLCISLGIYAINKIKAFIEFKKNELKASSKERASKVQTETAEKALDNHMCPSCGKDFILKKWDAPKKLTKENEDLFFGNITNYCRFCGLELFKPCSNCQTDNFVHLPFCRNCGSKLANDNSSEEIQ